jgi:hypothetical protein
MWERFKSDLRQEHLGTNPETASEEGLSVTATLKAPYEQPVTQSP